MKHARANFVEYSPDEIAEQEEYDAYYHDELPDSEAEVDPVANCGVVDSRPDAPDTADPEEDLETTPTVRTFTVRTHQPTPMTMQCLSQRIARAFHGQEPSKKRRREQSEEPSQERLPAPSGSGELLELPRQMARPPGCSFLGARAITVEACLLSNAGNPVPIILDSGSDITLISQKTLDSLSDPPRPRLGQKVKLIQVTGTATISGYVPLDLYFDTPQGPVKLFVEAYVVKGMSTPFILGNDFADQYSISLVRRGGETKVKFGSSDREMKVRNPLTDATGPQDENGHAFSPWPPRQIPPPVLSLPYSAFFSLTPALYPPHFSSIPPPIFHYPVHISFPP